MKKFSVQFTFEVDDSISKKDVKDHIIGWCANFNRFFGKITRMKVEELCQK